MNDLQAVSQHEIQGLTQIIKMKLDNATADYLTRELTLSERYITKRGIAKLIDEIQLKHIQQAASVVEFFQEIINEGILEKARSERDKHLSMLKEKNAGQFMEFANNELNVLSQTLRTRSLSIARELHAERCEIENDFKGTDEYYSLKEENEMNREILKNNRIALLKTYDERIRIKAESLRM